MFKHCVINILIVIIIMLGNAVYVNKSVCSTIYMYRVLQKNGNCIIGLVLVVFFMPCV